MQMSPNSLKCGQMIKYSGMIKTLKVYFAKDKADVAITMITQPFSNLLGGRRACWIQKYLLASCINKRTLLAKLRCLMHDYCLGGMDLWLNNMEQ